MNSVRMQPLFALGVLLLCLLALTPGAVLLAQSENSSATTTEEVPEQSATDVVETDPRALGYTVEGLPGGSAVIGDFVVGPGKIEVFAKPGETQVVELTATNRTGVDRLFLSVLKTRLVLATVARQ